jgi:ABC-2 type transport system ATP-binding protein
LCDRLAIVDHGKIIAEGSPAALIAKLGGHHVVEFALSDNSDANSGPWQSLPGVDSVRNDDGLVCLSVREPHRTIPALLAKVEEQSAQLERLTTRQASLEDVFVRLTGRHLREE